MNEYVPTIGLEIHAELKTRTKMFCNSKNDANETRPNVNICPVCLAHPGTLPVINREAVRHVLRVGAALNGKLADYTEFDRKNYFYPDLPKGYQISQYEYPLVSGGELLGVQITRVHLEEDTASSIHTDAGLLVEASAQTGETLIDYNRAGVPLMELVTEPVIHSAQQAGDFARELQLLLRYLGASDANMEKGEMRVEANISVARDGEMGTKVEVKNLNSFRAMERAVEYEIKRQSELLDKGETIAQETRGWDEAKQRTFPQRVKEVSADYRYFPDPDLPSLTLSQIPEFSPNILKAGLPELPEAKRDRYIKLGIKREDTEQYVQDTALGAFFEEVAEELHDAKLIQLASNYVANDLVMIISAFANAMADRRDIATRDTDLQRNIPISTEYFTKIIEMIGSGRISSRSAKDLLARTISEGKDPEDVAREEGLFIDTTSDNVDGAIGEVIAKHQSVVSDYKKGKEAALQFLIGQCMKALKGAVDPVMLKKKILEKIQ